MDWRNVYIKIVANAKNRERIDNETYEEHHILPRSLFPNWVKRKDNLVFLTLREHYFVHQLLVKIYPCRQMAFALWQMSMKYKNKNSRVYEAAKKLCKQYAVEFWNRPEIRLRSREQQVEIWKNEELLKKHSEILKEVMNRPEIAEKRNKGVKASRCTPVRCVQTGEVFNSLGDAANWCKIKAMAKIGQCARGERQHCGRHPVTKESLSWEYVGHINKKKDKVRKMRTKCEDLISHIEGLADE